MRVNQNMGGPLDEGATEPVLRQDGCLHLWPNTNTHWLLSTDAGHNLFSMLSLIKNRTLIALTPMHINIHIHLHQHIHIDGNAPTAGVCLCTIKCICIKCHNLRSSFICVWDFCYMQTLNNLNDFDSYLLHSVRSGKLLQPPDQITTNASTE